MNIREQYKLYCWAERVFKRNNAANYSAILLGACSDVNRLIEARHTFQHHLVMYFYYMQKGRQAMFVALQRPDDCAGQKKNAYYRFRVARNIRQSYHDLMGYPSAATLRRLGYDFKK